MQEEIHRNPALTILLNRGDPAERKNRCELKTQRGIRSQLYLYQSVSKQPSSLNGRFDDGVKRQTTAHTEVSQREREDKEMNY